MKRILVIENDIIPDKCVDVLVQHFYEEGDYIKEVTYAEHNFPVIKAVAKEMADATTGDDSFLVVVSTTFGNRSQVEDVMTLFSKLPVIPEIYISSGTHFVSKLLYGQSWTLPSSEFQNLVRFLLENTKVYDFYVPTFGDDVVEDIKPITLEALKKYKEKELELLK